MNESGHAKNCPICGNDCGRVILLSKNIAPMDQSQKIAHARNEKRANKPVFSITDSLGEKHDSGSSGEKPKEKRSKMPLL